MHHTIVQSPDNILRKKARALSHTEIEGEDIRGLIERMKKALSKEDNGVAIAAPQLGEAVALFVVAGKVFRDEYALHDEWHDRVFINPTITRTSRRKHAQSEGCLSVRGVFGHVLRHDKVTIAAQNEKGEPLTYHASGLLAQIFEHEVDHLQGVLFIDKMVDIED